VSASEEWRRIARNAKSDWETYRLSRKMSEYSLSQKIMQQIIFQRTFHDKEHSQIRYEPGSLRGSVSILFLFLMATTIVGLFVADCLNSELSESPNLETASVTIPADTSDPSHTDPLRHISIRHSEQFGKKQNAANYQTATVQTVFVPGDRDWKNSGVHIQAGQIINIKANGTIHVSRPKKHKENLNTSFSPSGTFHFMNEEIAKPFPLPAAGAGPTPCYALIGRVGRQGKPFYIGNRCSIVTSQTGDIWLGINDFNLKENTGGFEVKLTVGAALEPVCIRQRILPNYRGGSPKPGSDVLIIYVDGLRPDVVEEMSAMGHLPNITRVFLQGGTKLEHIFTAFPSDTITSNGTMWTGTFSDRHGMKAQVGFNRRKCTSENYLGKEGPVLSDRLLMPHGLDRFLLNGRTTIVKAVKGKKAAQRFHDLRTSETPTLRHYLARHNRKLGAGIMPVMNDLAPQFWSRYFADDAPFLGVQQAEQYIDEVNTDYAIDNLFRSDHAVTLVWLPETDAVSHHEFRGQFGMARRTIAEADRLIGKMISSLQRQNRLKKTYLILVSDHGHIGGRFSHLERFDLVNEFFHRPSKIDSEGRWVGGGLGLSVRQHRYFNPSRGDHKKDFVFLDSVGDGVAQVYLPKKHYGSRDWSGPNRIGDLMRFQIRQRKYGVDLIHALARFSTWSHRHDRKTSSAIGRIDSKNNPPNPTIKSADSGPIDLVLAKIDDRSVLIVNGMRGHAVIDRRRNKNERFEYRYRVVKNVRPTKDGGLKFDIVEHPRTDPLRFAGAIDSRLIGTYHSERKWLRITAGTIYPDSVVTMACHMLWQKHLRAREQVYAPDLVITANPGWQFNTINEPGTAHGHPFQETMRASLFLAGPNIFHGAILSEPARLVDLLPTVLEMAGIPYDAQEFDGKAIHSIYRSGKTQRSIVTMPLLWQDIELGGESPIVYAPRQEYPVQPRSVNRPGSFWDINNIVYNTLGLSETSVNRVIGDAARLAGIRFRPLRSTYRWANDEFKREHVDTPNLQLNKVSLGDYSWYSTGNLQRLNNSVD